MVTLERLGFHEISERELYLVHVESAEQLSTFQTPSRHFACLLLWDAEGEPVAQLSHVAATVLDSGCSYLSAWGSDCERVHDVFDEDHGMNPRDTPDDSVVMTSWHDDESLSDALFFFFYCAHPDDHFEATTGTGVVIVIGDGESTLTQVRSALQDSTAFLRNLDEEQGGEMASGPEKPSPTKRPLTWTAQLLVVALTVVFLFFGYDLFNGWPTYSTWEKSRQSLGLLAIGVVVWDLFVSPPAPSRYRSICTVCLRAAVVLLLLVG